MATRTPTYVSEARAEGYAEGRVKGRVDSILRVLARRGLAVHDADRDRITSCADLETLGTWLDRSVDAAQAKDIFGD